MLLHWKTSRTLALTALVAVTAIWGSTFLLVKNVIQQVPVMDFLAVRFLLAAVVMIALRPKCLLSLTKRGLLRGIVLGVVLGTAYVTQTYGLRTASATVSGFITGTFVVLTPIVSWILLRQKTSRNTWLAVALSCLGLALLGLHGWSIGIGELLTLVCALFIAIHVVGLGAWASQHEIYGFAFIQVATVAVISLVTTAPDGIKVPFEADIWGTIIITAVFATAIAFFVQTWAQSLMPPTHAAVVMTMEPVFAGIFGVVFGGDRLTLQILAGVLCVLVAMVIIQFVKKPASTYR
jgi:drug/metabolite transporter (DMT)-like permease